MLALRRHFYSHAQSNAHPALDFPHSVRRSVQHKFAFAPVINEEDEILDQIDDARQAVWELGDQPEGELEAFWDNVVADVRSDPSWNFASDE